MNLKTRKNIFYKVAQHDTQQGNKKANIFSLATSRLLRASCHFICGASPTRPAGTWEEWGEWQGEAVLRHRQQRLTLTAIWETETNTQHNHGHRHRRMNAPWWESTHCVTAVNTWHIALRQTLSSVTVLGRYLTREHNKNTQSCTERENN